jgi:hypothetical protein
VKDYRWRAADRKPQQTSTWWARGELNHSTAASYLGLYPNPQVSAVVVGRRQSFGAVPRRAVMPGGITARYHSRARGVDSPTVSGSSFGAVSV